MSITAEFRVCVKIPDEVHSNFHGTAEYKRKLIAATEGSIDDEISYQCIGVFQHATFRTWKEARQCEEKLLQVIYYFAAKLLPD